jgi:hypothetical protein
MTDRQVVIDHLENSYKELYATLQKEIEAQSPDSNFMLALRCGVVSALGAFKQYKSRLKTPEIYHVALK